MGSHVAALRQEMSLFPTSPACYSQGKAVSIPRGGVEFQQLPFLFFGIRLTHEPEIKFLAFLLE